MQFFLNLLNDPKVLLGIAILVILFIVFIFAAFPSKQKNRKPKPTQPMVEEKPVFSAEALVHELLSDRRWQLASLEQIAQYVGGYKDDELRQLLVRAGALQFGTGSGPEELWGLLERNRRKLTPDIIKAALPEDTPKSKLLKPGMPKILSQTKKMPVFSSGEDTPAEHDTDEEKTEKID